MIAERRMLPPNFVRDVIMKAPGQDIMNSMTKSVLTLASYDDRVSDNSVENVLRQSMSLISVFPMLAVYWLSMPTITTIWGGACTSTAPTRTAPQQKTSSICFVRIRNIRSWRLGFLIRP